MLEIELIVPERAGNLIESDLVKLTQILVENGHAEYRGGLLGGLYGYGANFKNDVFMMHSYCWCDEEDCPWCDCTGQAGTEYGAEPGRPAPNFWYYGKSGQEIKIWWYKWIGRGMEYNRTVDAKEWLLIFKECLDSLRMSSDGLDD